MIDKFGKRCSALLVISHQAKRLSHREILLSTQQSVKLSNNNNKQTKKPKPSKKYTPYLVKEQLELTYTTGGSDY